MELKKEEPWCYLVRSGTMTLLQEGGGVEMLSKGRDYFVELGGR